MGERDKDHKKHPKHYPQGYTRYVFTSHVLVRVMAINNSRPLTYECLNDPKSLEPLTPNHLLTMKSKTLLPLPGNFVKEEGYARNGGDEFGI